MTDEERDALTAKILAEARRARSEGMRASRMRRLAAGRSVGWGTPLGLSPGEREARALARAYRAEGLSLRAVSTRLAGLGYVGRTGRPYAPSSVARLAALTANQEDTT